MTEKTAVVGEPVGLGYLIRELIAAILDIDASLDEENIAKIDMLVRTLNQWRLDLVNHIYPSEPYLLFEEFPPAPCPDYWWSKGEAIPDNPGIYDEGPADEKLGEEPPIHG